MRDLGRPRSLPRTIPTDPRDDQDDSPTARPKPASFDGRYLLLQELGKGGMGAVWVAYDTKEMRRVALKRILPDGEGNESFRERFRREYRALGALHHPGVPTLYTSGEAPDGTPYFTMELIRGDTLRKVLDQAPLDPVHALALAIELGRILMAVHAAGIVHRDVKPGNVLIEPGGRVRLIDFGACLPLQDFYRREDITQVTATGVRWGTGEHEIIGTPAYTDPAAMREKQTTIRSDIYSVCAIVYEAITGRARLDRESMTLRAIKTGEFPPQLARLAAELRRGTERQPSLRHRSMAELVQALEIIRSDLLRERMQVSSPPRVRAARLAFSSVLLASVAAMTLYMAMRPVAGPARTPGETGSPAEVALLSAVPREEPRGPSRLDTDAPALTDDDAACEVLAATHPRGGEPARALSNAAPEPVPAGAVQDLGPPAPTEPEGGHAILEPTSPRRNRPSPTSAGRRPPSTSTTVTAALRRARPSLRACQPGGAPLTAQVVIRGERATVVTINDELFDDSDPLHACVAAAISRLAFPVTESPVVRTIAL